VDLHPFQRILVPVGRARAVGQALTVALELAETTGAALRLLSVGKPVDDELLARLTAHAARSARSTEVETRVVGYGSVARAIAAAAADPGTLVCMPSHGAYGPARTLAGTVTADVIRSVQDPVLVVGPRVPPSASLGGGRIVACLDGSPTDEQTLAPARRWSAALGLPLWLVHVTSSHDPNDGPARSAGMSPERWLEDIARSDVAVAGWQVQHDRHPARALAAMAQATPVAVFVMTTLARRGWPRVFAGSVSASTVRRASSPVLVSCSCRPVVHP
jgi:nucleotide-binding universal stress UspA family protein